MLDAIPANVAAVRQRIAGACARAGRSAADVTLIAVSKTFPAEAIDAVVAAGVRAVGENKVQEAREKRPVVTASAEWHLIGHLQSNKAKEAVRLFDVIHTIDSIALAEKVARNAEGRQSILLQVNVGGESQKSGVDPSELESFNRLVSALPELHVRGLMTIPPVAEPEQTRHHFRELRRMRDDLGLEHLSMGMSEDFEIAIEEGATMVRVGRAIFGSRG
jgi:pyridoxal phosphate enzyme (YggS family)